MACPLTLLREYNVNRLKIAETDEHVIFGDVSWPKSVKTSYLMYRSNANDPAKAYYTLGCLLYLLKNERLPHGAYIKKANNDGVPFVSRPDRRELLAYLNGETATNKSIDKLAPLEPPTKVSKRLAEAPLDAVSAAKKLRLDNIENEPYHNDSIRAQKVKEQLAAKLDPTQEVTVVVDNIKSLSEAMSVEKIAAIKAKRIAKKRTTIKDLNDDVDMIDSALDYGYMDDGDSTKKILARERHYRNRATILQSTGREFLSNVLSILKSVTAKEAAASKRVVTPAPAVMATPKRPAPRNQGYDRYDQQRFVPQKEAAEGFVIDTTISYHGWSLKSVKEASMKNPVVAKPTPAVPTQQVIAPVKRASKMPIIVVPSSENSLITTYNAMDILQDLSYKSTAQKKAMKNVKRENEVMLQRRKTGNLTVPYLVVENPLKLKKEDWERVVAVFVMGPAWQFKGWPFGGNPVEIFARIPAFHFKYDDMPTDPNVAKWAVKIIELNKNRRHLDKAAIIKFWEALDGHMVTNKPHLRF